MNRHVHVGPGSILGCATTGKNLTASRAAKRLLSDSNGILAEWFSPCTHFCSRYCNFNDLFIPMPITTM